MPAPANTFTSNQMVGIREDLSDMIWNIDPYDTPLTSASPKMTAENRFVEWQTDTLAAPGDNAHIEGDDTTAELVAPTVRVGNRTQIFKKSVQISGTDAGLTKAGRGKEMATQILKRTREMKLDIEMAMFANQAQVVGSGVMAARMAGLGAWVTTNVNNVGGGGGNPTGNGTNARTDGALTAFIQDDFDLTMQEIWTEGGRAERVYLSPFQLNAATAFVGMNNQRSNIDASRDEVRNSLDVYVTNFGKVEFVPSRLCRPRDVWVVQSDVVKVATLRALKNSELAKTGDSDKRELVTELTMCVGNEQALGLVADCTLS